MSDDFNRRYIKTLLETRRIGKRIDRQLNLPPTKIGRKKRFVLELTNKEQKAIRLILVAGSGYLFHMIMDAEKDS